MQILFIWPGIYLGWNVLGNGFEQSSINHGLSSLSAVLKREGHNCFLIDLRSCKNWEHFEEIIKKQEFDLVLVGFYSVDENFADQSIRIIKRHFPDKSIICGGVHLTFGQITQFSLADCIVWGEGESVINELVENKDLPRQISAAKIENLDALPFIDRNLFNIEYEKNNPLFPLLSTPHHTINFSRGCPYSCSFCLESKNMLWKGYRVRSPGSCIDELKSLGSIGSLMIHDDTFPPRVWCEEYIELFHKSFNRIPFFCQMRADWICRNEEIISELAKIGLTWCSLGIEGSQRMLDFYNKRLTTQEVIKAANILHKNKVNIFGNYILGSPTETLNDINELEEILKQVRPEWHSASTYTAYPGSKLFDFCVENNLFVGDGTKDEDYYSMTRYPYERKIVGVDYEYIRKKQIEFNQFREELKEWNK